MLPFLEEVLRAVLKADLINATVQVGFFLHPLSLIRDLPHAAHAFGKVLRAVLQARHRLPHL
jgi:hypothetical protein